MPRRPAARWPPRGVQEPDNSGRFSLSARRERSVPWFQGTAWTGGIGGRWGGCTPLGLTDDKRRSSVSTWPATMRYEGLFVLRSEEHTSELQSLRHLVCRL